jgi:hypothetical protein
MLGKPSAACYLPSLGGTVAYRLAQSETCASALLFWDDLLPSPAASGDVHNRPVVSRICHGAAKWKDCAMTDVPTTPLVPGNSLITATPEEGRALALMLARHTIHAMQNQLEVLQNGRAQYAHDPYGLIAASHVVAVEFATVAAANDYWRGKPST